MNNVVNLFGNASDKNTRDMMSDTKFYSDYSRFKDEENRYETWEEATTRVMDMHKKFYKDKMTDELMNIVNEIGISYKNKEILGSQRALQFGGEQLLKKHMKLYNCSSTYADRPEYFGQFYWILLCGAGVGVSVSKIYTDKLPPVQKRTKQSKIHIIEDSIEGWATAADVLMSSYFVGGGLYPEYEGRRIYFDMSQIRPKGAYISGGFKAPGPGPLRRGLDKIEALLEKLLEHENTAKLAPIHVYDISMHIADSVISGGLRRSACLFLFDIDDEEMLKAKTGNWFEENPQRGRSNNSVILIRDKISKEEFTEIFNSTKEYGEPGFAFMDSEKFAYNPCFTGDTIVAVADGRNGVTIKDLADEDKNFPVYSARVGAHGKWVTEIKNAIAFKTGTRDIIKVTLSDGTSIRCTPNHKLALPNGEYVEAKYSMGMELEGFFTNKPGENPVVVNIEDSGNEDVYDLTVDDNHNFYILTDYDSDYKNSTGVLVHNCFEIGMHPQTASGESGISVCNLTEINGAKCNTEEDFYHACRMASALGTLQAGYTKFDFLGPISEEIIERDALIGVSITGFMNNPKILFDERILKRGAQIVKETNKQVAKLIGINPAARCTAVKPSGNASVILGTTSGIHAEHSPRYIRNVQLNKDSEVVQLIKKINPYMIEESAWNANSTDYVVSFPIISPEDSIYKDQLYGINLLEKVKTVQQTWIEEGTNEEYCMDKRLRHNVSNTVTVLPNQWEEVKDYLYENKQYFAGVSFLSNSGDYDYIQAPFTQILTEEEILQEYGRGAMFASGLIVDSIKGFANLWEACRIAQQHIDDGDQEQVDSRADWVRRFKNYTDNYFHGNAKRSEYCLKAVHLLHKWAKIQQNMVDISFVSELEERKYTDIDTLSAQACSGGACEIDF